MQQRVARCSTSTISIFSRARRSSRTNGISTASTASSGIVFKGIETPTDPQSRTAGRMAEKARRALSDRGGESAGRGARRLGKADGDVAPAARRAERRGTRAATNGSAPAAPRRSARMATTPKGVRIGQERRRNRSAVKVWDQREFRNLDDTVELGTRNIKLALAPSAPIRARRAPSSSSISTARSTRPRTTPAGSI